MIEVQNLTKTFGLHKAVDDISFQAQTGEIIGLLGPNGAGKTTTMRILTGYMPPTSGSARIAGFDVFEESLLARQRVGYLPETVPVYPDMTVLGYVKFWAELRGVQRPRARAEAVIEQVQLTSRKHSLIRNLSKGMRQRLGLAQAIVHDPDVIILDEPTIGIDPQQVIEVRASVRALSQNHTVLFSTHILSEAEQVCDRVLIMNQGRIIAAGPPANLRQQIQRGADLYVHIEGDARANIRRMLEAIAGVTDVEDQAAGFNLRVTTSTDVRQTLITQVQQAGYQLLEMRPVAVTLEDIFLDLVGKN
jgi:ABC-2 type transport system ATP-binding protein